MSGGIEWDGPGQEAILAAMQDEWDRLDGFDAEIADFFDDICERAGDHPFHGQGILGQIIWEAEKRKERPPERSDGRTPIGSRLRRLIYERDAYRCVTCGGWIDLSIDHVIPVSRGGGNEESNLQTMCRPCNSSKGVK